MSDHRVLTGITTAMLSLVVLGCAGPAAETGVRLADAGSSPASTAGLCGTWLGDFSYIGSDHQSSTGSSDIVLQVGGDSSYTLKWGGHRASTGRVTARANRVVLADQSGSRITLFHSGNALYGVIRDPGNGESTMMNLEKRESAPSRFAGTGPRC